MAFPVYFSAPFPHVRLIHARKLEIQRLIPLQLGISRCSKAMICEKMEGGQTQQNDASGYSKNSLAQHVRPAGSWPAAKLPNRSRRRCSYSHTVTYGSVAKYVRVRSLG